MGPVRFQAGVFRKWNNANIRMELRFIIGAAKKLKRATQMTRHSGVEPVDVMRGVAFAVFEAKDINWW